jgi:hypothetical protein
MASGDGLPRLELLLLAVDAMLSVASMDSAVVAMPSVASTSVCALLRAALLSEQGIEVHVDKSS